MPRPYLARGPAQTSFPAPGISELGLSIAAGRITDLLLFQLAYRPRSGRRNIKICRSILNQQLRPTTRAVLASPRRLIHPLISVYCDL
jgi:hypothetical protein